MPKLSNFKISRRGNLNARKRKEDFSELQTKLNNLTKEFETIKNFLHKEFNVKFDDFCKKDVIVEPEIIETVKPVVCSEKAILRKLPLYNVKENFPNDVEKENPVILDPERIKHHMALLCSGSSEESTEKGYETLEEMPYNFLCDYDNWNMAKLQLRKQGWTICYPFKIREELIICTFNCRKGEPYGSCLKKLVIIKQAENSLFSLYIDKLEHSNHLTEVEKQLSSSHVRKSLRIIREEKKKMNCISQERGKASETHTKKRKQERPRNETTMYEKPLFLQNSQLFEQCRNRLDFPATDTYSYMAPPPLMEVEEEQEIKLEALYPIFNFDEETEEAEEMPQQVNIKLEEVEEAEEMTFPIDPIGLPSNDY